VPAKVEGVFSIAWANTTQWAGPGKEVESKEGGGHIERAEVRKRGLEERRENAKSKAKTR
jgi:hypothetical protein